MIVERMDPVTSDDAVNRAFHLERYRWAVERVQGSDVLDIACGVGYGAAMLADALSHPRVIGVDRAADAIAIATSRYGSERVAFLVIEDAESFETERRFDTIVTFETIEHLAHPVRFLRRMHALLRPGGRLIISAPVREQPGDNPHHRHCFRPESLRALVAEGFALEDELWQAGAYLTLVASRREVPCRAWSMTSGEAAPPATIVLVTWNARENVTDLVSAIRSFSIPPYDLLVVDNASTDGTLSVLQLLDGEPGFRLLTNPSNKKCAAATNQALAMARSEFVIYLCASHAMVVEESWNERLVRWLQERPDVAIAGDVWDPGFVVASQRYAPGFDPDSVPPEKRRHVQGGAWIARRAALRDLGGFNEAEHPHGGMDVEFSLLLTSRGLPLGACPDILCPQAPGLPERRAGVSVVHPATSAIREEVRRTLGILPREGSMSVASGPLPAGWSCARGFVRGLGESAFHVRAHGTDSGLLSDGSYTDVRIRGRVQSHGIANVKARIESRDDPAADGYHVLLGPGTNYLARANHVLARFPPPSADCRFELTLAGSRIVLALDGREVARVEDTKLRSGPVFVGVNAGEAVYSEMAIAPLMPAPSRGLSGRAPIVVYCERLENESFCESVIRVLAETYDVRTFGPGWPEATLSPAAIAAARFFLYLDSASGTFPLPEGLDRIAIPKFAWIIDAHKKPIFHQALARQMDLTFFTMKTWGHLFDSPAAWLPLHCDAEIFRPIEVAREYDIVFVGSQTWRAEPIERIAKKHGLRILVTTTTGPREKSETAAIYAKARLVFNRHVTNDLNFRVFEAMACGRVLLTDAQWNGQYDLFEDGRHYVLYKDEKDLEAQILRLLAEDDGRVRIEREAAAVFTARHSTRMRTGQLVAAIEAIVERRAPTAPTVDVPRAARAETRARSPLRWLFFVGNAPPTVLERSYAEEVAWSLAARGHEVMVARERRCRFPHPPAKAGEPRIFELSIGPLPLPPAPVNAILARAGPLHVRLDAIAREHGPFDVIAGEDALGGLVARPLAERLRVPFLLCLEESLVGKRENKLGREDLYLAELEHWGADAAAAIVVARGDAVEAVERHYRAKKVCVVEPTMRGRETVRDAARFLRRLGLEEDRYSVALTTSSGEDALRDATVPVGDGDNAVVLTADAVWIRRASGELVRVAARAATGPALAVLLACARRVSNDPRDPRARDVAAAHGPSAMTSGSGFEDLEGLLFSLVPARAPEVAHVL